MRIKPGAMFLTGIIPGPKEPKNMDPYLDIVVDDILDLENVTVYDAYKNESFSLKGNVLLHVLDYPGQNKVFKSQGMMCMHIYMGANCMCISPGYMSSYICIDM